MKKEISSWTIASIVFVAVFGFSNIPNNFAIFGPSAITWFIIGAAFALIFAFAVADLGLINKKSEAGLSAWVSTGLGSKGGLIAAWAFFVSQIFYLPTLLSRIPVFLSWTFSNASYEDIINNNGNVSGILNAQSDPILFVLLTALFLLFGFMIALKFEKITDVLGKYTGTLSMSVTILFIVVAFSTILLLGKTPETKIAFSDLKIDFSDKTLYSSIAWIVFAYTGAEVVGSFMTRTKKPQKIIPKGLMVGTLLIAIMYIVSIFATSIIATKESLPSSSLEQLLPLLYAKAFYSAGLPIIFLKLVTFIYALITFVAYILWSTTNVRILFSELPEEILSKDKKFKSNELGTPIIGLVGQTLMVLLFLVFSVISNNSGEGTNIYKTLYNFSTMAIILPYILLFVSLFFVTSEKIGIIKNIVIRKTLGLVGFIMTTFAFLAIGWDVGLEESERFNNAITMFGGLSLFIFIGVIIYILIIAKKNKNKNKNTNSMI
jgi:amino acid transporter